MILYTEPETTFSNRFIINPDEAAGGVGNIFNTAVLAYGNAIGGGYGLPDDEGLDYICEQKIINKEIILY